MPVIWARSLRRMARYNVPIRDVDETVIGNPNHNLIRLALSLASAARGSDLPGVTTAHMLGQMMIGYLRALKGPKGQNLRQTGKHQGCDATGPSARRSLSASAGAALFWSLSKYTYTSHPRFFQFWIRLIQADWVLRA